MPNGYRRGGAPICALTAVSESDWQRRPGAGKVTPTSLATFHERSMNKPTLDCVSIILRGTNRLLRSGDSPRPRALLSSLASLTETGLRGTPPVPAAQADDVPVDRSTVQNRGS